MKNDHFINMVKQAAAAYAEKKNKQTEAANNSPLCQKLKSMKGKLTSSAAHDPNNRINTSLRKNKCAEEQEPLISPPQKKEAEETQQQEKTASEVRHEELKEAVDEYVKLVVDDIKAARLG